MNFKSWKFVWSARVIVSALIAGLLVPGATVTPASASAACADFQYLHRPATDQTTMRAFYADINGSDTLRSGYVGYQFSETSTASTATAYAGVEDLWIRIGTFQAASGSPVLGRAVNQSQDIPVRSLAQTANSSGNRVAYAYLTATAATLVDQTWTVTVSRGKFGSPNYSEICTFQDGFTEVYDSIAARANKIDALSISTTSPVLGGSFYVEAQGTTGTMGAGIASDQIVSGRNEFGVLSLAPSADNAWPADAFTLTGVSMDLGNTGTWQHDRLRIYPTSSASTTYTVRYYFTARKTTTAAVPVLPVQTIASGTQVKYTADYNAAALKSIAPVTQNVSISKSVTNVVEIGSTDPRVFDVSYRVDATNKSTTTSVLDSIKDTPSVGAGGAFVAPTISGTVTGTLSTGSTKTGQVVGGTATTRPTVFSGPLSVPGGSTLSLTYTIRVSYVAGTATMPVLNNAVAYIGDVELAALTGINATGVNITNLNLASTKVLTLIAPATTSLATTETSTANTLCTASGSTSNCTYVAGSVVTISATPPSGQALIGWTVTGGGTTTCTGTTNPCAIALTADASVQPIYGSAYSVTANGTNFSLSDQTGAYNCSGTTCQKTTTGSPILVFVADPGWEIETITASTASDVIVCTNFADCQLSALDSNVVLSVTTRPILTVIVVGSGSVTSSPVGITTCAASSGDCIQSYAANTAVTLTGTPSGGSQIQSWSGGGCTGTNSACVVTLTAPTTVTITFSGGTVTLTVTVIGSGSVSSDTGTITTCAASTGVCSTTLPYETEVILSATAASGWQLSSWSGLSCSGTSGACTLTLLTSGTVTVTFTQLANNNTTPTPNPTPIREVPSTDPTSPRILPPSNTTGTDPGQIPVGNLPPNSSLEIARDRLPAGINDARINNGVIEYTPAPGFSGNTFVPLLLNQNGVLTIILVPVTVLPVAPAEGRFTPTSPTNTVLRWEPSPNAIGYEVLVNTRSVCVTTQTTECALSTILGPKAKIEVIAKGNDGTVSKKTLPAYAPERPIPVLTVNFAVDSFRITPTAKRRMDAFVKMMREQGFTRVVIEGHTDNQGGARGAQALSRNRARVVAAYLDQFLNVSFAKAQFGEKRPTAPNTTSRGQAANRRATGAVW